MKRRALAWAAFGALACGPVIAVQHEDSTSGDGVMSTSTTTPATTTAGEDEGTTAVSPEPDPDPPTPGSTSTTTGESSEGGVEDPSVGFIVDPDGGLGGCECDVWAQDCPRGEKCMPWANDGGNSWNATRCSAIDPDPKAAGEPCTAVDSGVSGIDDCVIAAMCWDVDPDTNMGTCVAFCQGSEANPTCADPCTTCAQNGEGVLILCLPGCDPIAQDCSEGQACYPYSGSFTCAPDVSDDEGAVGDPCEFINVCDPGNWCASPDLVPGCEGASGCCSPFCNVDALDGCDALLPGTTCVPWYEDSEPQCLTTGTVGACMVVL